MEAESEREREMKNQSGRLVFDKINSNSHFNVEEFPSSLPSNYNTMKKCKNPNSSLTLFLLGFCTLSCLLWDSGGFSSNNANGLIFRPVFANTNNVNSHHHHEIESCFVQTSSSASPSINSQSSSNSPFSNSHQATSHHLANSAINTNNNNNAGGGGGDGLVQVQVLENELNLKSDLVNNNNNANNANNNVNPITICHIRTLHSDLDIENLTSTLPLPSITKLTLICNDVLFFESILNPEQLIKLSELQELSIEKCKLKYLPSSSFNGLYHLRRLSIKTGNSDWAARSLEISIGAFNNIPNLRHLNLGFNHMWNLPEKLLCQLSSLQSLNLTHNLLSDMLDLGLPKHVTLSIFENINSERSATTSSCLNELKSLDLSYNNLPSLSGRRFETMRRLAELRIEHNLLENLHDDSFYGLSSLKLLNLSSNKLVALSSKLFIPCKMLKELDLRNNSISSLSPGLLSTLEYLQILDLSSNQLSSNWITSEETFKGLVRLIILNLANNQITHLSISSFIDLHQVQNLNLENNAIESIEDSTFAHLNNLHTLNLARNKLIRISSSMLNGLFVLSKLSLDHNLISDIQPGSFRNCTSLQDLGLVGNQFNSVPEALQGLALLKTLDIGENLISSLSNDSFQGLGQLYGLRIVGNRLSSLPKSLCDPLKRLRVFNLAQNRIAKIGSNSFVGCPELRVLLLNSNSLEEIPTSLSSQLNSLLWLNVSQNHIKSLNYHLLPTSLEWIDISHNQIDSLSGAWTISSSSASSNNTPGRVNNNNSTTESHSPHHLRLRVIDASHNQLTQLDYHSIPSSLETLHLGHNKISKISPDTFGRSNHLRRVELFGNQLENLVLSALRLPSPNSPSENQHHHHHSHTSQLRSTSPVEFYLGGNPFLCDCELEWLTKINSPQIGGGIRQYPIVVDLDAIVCRLTYSRSESRIPLPSMKSSDFLCKYESICFSTCHCCGFTCDCEMTCSSNCSCYHDDNWSANVVDCSNSDHSTIPNNLPMDSTDVYLDGNDIPILKSHTFIGRKNLKVLFLNDSNIQTIANKSFNGLQSLKILHLENNKLRKLEGFEFEQLSTLNELYLNDNLLESISNTTFLTLKSLEILRIDGNHLVTFTVWQLSLNPYLVDIGIARNRWNCGDCVFLHAFYGWVTDNSKKIMDLVQIRCVWNTSLEQGPHLMDYNNTCGASWTLLPGAFEDFDLNTAAPFIILSVVFLILIGSVTIIIVCRDTVRVWIFSTFGLRLCAGRRYSSGHHHHHGHDDDVNCNVHGHCCAGGVVGSVGHERGGCGPHGHIGDGSNGDKSCCYDSYFIYSEKDEEFITSRITDDLEAIDYYRLCLQNRDLIYSSGADLKDLMASAVQNCKSIVIFLSRNFFQADWTSPEYRNALYSVLKSVSRGDNHSKNNGGNHYSNKPIIIVFIEPIPETEMSSDLKSWLRNNKIHKQLHFGAKRFWQTFKYLLPDPSSQYQSNITSHTTSSSASSSAAGGGPGSSCTAERPGSKTLNKYNCEVVANDDVDLNSVIQQQLQQSHQNHHHHILPSSHHVANSQFVQEQLAQQQAGILGLMAAATGENNISLNKLWPYAQSLIAVQPAAPPPKYGSTNNNNQKSNSNSNSSHNNHTGEISPSHGHHHNNLPILGPQQLVQNSSPSVSPSSSSSPSTISSSSPAHKQQQQQHNGNNNGTKSQSPPLSNTESNNHTSATTTDDDVTLSSIPSFLFQPNIASPVPLGHFRTTANSHNHNSEHNAYNDGEHVYSTLDPPSPQHRNHLLQQYQQQQQQQQQNSLQFPKSQQHQYQQQHFIPQQLPSSQHNNSMMIMNNIHLPNGYTYSPQQWHHHHSPPVPQIPQVPPPSYSSSSGSNNSSVGTGRSQQQPPNSHKLSLGGLMTTMTAGNGSASSSNNGHHHGQQQHQQARAKDSVQTYLV